MHVRTSCLILLWLCLPVQCDSTLNGWFNDEVRATWWMNRFRVDSLDSLQKESMMNVTFEVHLILLRMDGRRPDRLQSFHHGIFKRYLCRVRFNHKRESMRSQVVRRIATTLITLYSRTDFKVNSANPSLLEDLLGNVTFPWQYNYIYASLVNWGKWNRFILMIRVHFIINFIKKPDIIIKILYKLIFYFLGGGG